MVTHGLPLLSSAVVISHHAVDVSVSHGSVAVGVCQQRSTSLHCLLRITLVRTATHTNTTHSILLVYSQVRQHSQAFFGLHLGLTLPNPSIFRQSLNSATGGHPCRVGMHLLVCKQVQLYRSASAAGWMTPSHAQHAASHGRRQPYDLNSSIIISSVPSLSLSQPITREPLSYFNTAHPPIHSHLSWLSLSRIHQDKMHPF